MVLLAQERSHSFEHEQCSLRQALTGSANRALLHVGHGRVSPGSGSSRRERDRDRRFPSVPLRPKGALFESGTNDRIKHGDSADADCCLAKAALPERLPLALAERRSGGTSLADWWRYSVASASGLPGGSSDVTSASTPMVLAQTSSVNRQ
jgi:hypothetical protein